MREVLGGRGYGLVSFLVWVENVRDGNVWSNICHYDFVGGPPTFQLSCMARIPL